MRELWYCGRGGMPARVNGKPYDPWPLVLFSPDMAPKRGDGPAERGQLRAASGSGSRPAHMFYSRIVSIPPDAGCASSRPREDEGARVVASAVPSRLHAVSPCPGQARKLARFQPAQGRAGKEVLRPGRPRPSPRRRGRRVYCDTCSTFVVHGVFLHHDISPTSGLPQAAKAKAKPKAQADEPCTGQCVLSLRAPVWKGQEPFSRMSSFLHS